jgi:transposase
MYFRDSTRRYKDRIYHSIQLVQCYRHPETRKPTTRVIASLGDLSKMDEGDRLSLVVSLARALGVLDLVHLSSDEIALADMSAATARARSVGAMWAILEIMRQLHIPQVWEELTSGRKNHRSLARHLTALLCNRLDDPGSKLSLLAWLERVFIPGIDPEDITYQGLLRTMDVLLEHKDAIEKALAERLLTMFDTELDLVLMDVTSISVSTTSSDHPLFAHGYSRDGHPERKQYVLMMVTTKDGIPVYHDVHPGNTADATLVRETMEKARKIFPQVDRCMVVGDRAMLSEKNLAALAELGFDHLTAMPLKREASTREIIEKTHDELVQKAEEAMRGLEEGEKIPEVWTEEEVDDGRVVVAYSKRIAVAERERRWAKLEAFDDKAALIEARLRGKVKSRGRPLTDEGAFKQLVKEALEKKVTAYFRIELRGSFLWVEPIEEAQEYADRCDGKLAMHTDNRDLEAGELYRIYKDLQEIERSWRTLKSAIKIRPTFHWTERRVRAHVFLCVLALVIERVMRLKLRAATSDYSPQRALVELRQLMHVRLTLPTKDMKYDILANKKPIQLELYRALDVPPLTDARLRRLLM